MLRTPIRPRARLRSHSSMRVCTFVRVSSTCKTVWQRASDMSGEELRIFTAYASPEDTHTCVRARACVRAYVRACACKRGGGGAVGERVGA